MFQAKKLEELMKKNKTKGKELAKIIGVSETTISSWKNGDKIPKIENIEKIAKYYNIPIEYLIEEKELNSRYNIKEINNNSNIVIGENTKVQIIKKEELEPIDITILELIKKMELEEKAEIIKFIAQKNKK